MCLNLKTINAELANRGYTARLAKAAFGYFYFESGGCGLAGLDRTVNVPTVNSLSLVEWMAEFERLKNVNAEIMGGVKGRKPAPRQKQSKGGR